MKIPGEPERHITIGTAHDQGKTIAEPRKFTNDSIMNCHHELIPMPKIDGTSNDVHEKICKLCATAFRVDPKKS